MIARVCSAQITDTAAGRDVQDVSDVITMLDENTDYSLSVVAVNLFGAGPAVKLNVSTPSRDSSESPRN